MLALFESQQAITKKKNIVGLYFNRTESGSLNFHSRPRVGIRKRFIFVGALYANFGRNPANIEANVAVYGMQACPSYAVKDF